jgi:hypothetical protein
VATASQWYAQSGGNLIARLWTPQDMKVALMKSTYSPNLDTNLRYSDIAAEELVAGGGYTVGGKSLTGKSVSYDATANEYNLLAADLSWGPGATFQTRYGVLYEGDTTDKYLWALLDFGALQDISNGTFLLDWATNVLAITQGPPV